MLMTHNYPISLTKWVRKGLLLAIQRGYHDIIIESDALHIVSALHSGLPNGSLIGNIMEDSKALLSTITGAIATHTRHQNNEVAHRIARYALSSLANCSWFEELPDIISNILISDCNV
ncbi:unnamed protein product [Malus baccata var. baccata]